MSIALALCGLAGMAYGLIVVRRTRRQTGYEPVREDWLWYAILPIGLYGLLALAALLLAAAARLAPFAVGAAALGLLLLGIRNAWDALVHMVAADPGGDATKAG